ncbi:MAG TPA: hypothetical protein VLL72_05215 [Kiloniellales bacterium]|nr:hypothetical protein [Kiloniellales bacterium]
MEQIEFPDLRTWEARRQWFEAQEQAASQSGAPAPSEQAVALMLDLQATFCVGAWAATVVLAAAILDSQARESGDRFAPVPGVRNSEVRWLRDLRNRLLHEDRTNPVLTIDDQWLGRGTWERKARRAVSAAITALYPGSAALEPTEQDWD